MSYREKKAQCDGKKTYSHKEAKRMRGYLGTNRRKELRYYECDICYGWHLTKQSKKLND